MQGMVDAAAKRIRCTPIPVKPQFAKNASEEGYFGDQNIGRPGHRTMEVIGGSTVSYLARTPCVPVLLLISINSGSKGAFRLPGGDVGSLLLYVGTLARSYSVSSI